MIIQICETPVEIDDDDKDLVLSYKWFVHRTQLKKNGKYYFICNYKKNKQVLLHRIIMNAIYYNGMVVDHIDGNTLNNKKSNLRLCHQYGNAENQKISKRNTSGYKGVSWSSLYNKWVSKIHCRNKYHFLGYFNDPEQAYKAYCEASIKYHGEFSRLK